MFYDSGIGMEDWSWLGTNRDQNTSKKFILNIKRFLFCDVFLKLLVGRFSVRFYAPDYRGTKVNSLSISLLYLARNGGYNCARILLAEIHFSVFTIFILYWAHELTPTYSRESPYLRAHDSRRQKDSKGNRGLLWATFDLLGVDEQHTLGTFFMCDRLTVPRHAATRGRQTFWNRLLCSKTVSKLFCCYLMPNSDLALLP